MTERKTGGGDSPGNPMPPLLRAVRAALTESIRHHGIIVPVVKDQTGYVLDGYNRITIGTELGVPIPETIHECDPSDRDILRVELNGARRQLEPEQWKPLVDHLRSQAENGTRLYSDRVIATAVGVARETVRTYKSPVSATDQSRSVASKNVGEDGKVRPVGGEWTAVDRALHLILQSKEGLTASELLSDEVLAEFSQSTVSRIPGVLRDRKLVVANGKRGQSTVWVAAPDKPAVQPARETAVSRQASSVVTKLADPKVLEEVKAQLADQKGTREAEATLKVAEKELEAARVAEEKREADAEKERLRLAEITRGHVEKSVKTWDKLIAEVRMAWTIIAVYMKVFDDLPPIVPSYTWMLNRELLELRQQLDWFDKRLNPYGQAAPVQKGTVIDV